MITISIVSHGHRHLISVLLADLSEMPEISGIVLTLNIPEEAPDVPSSLQNKVLIIRNDVAKGFGANHNAAFTHCKTDYFCVLNPDARLPDNPFPRLLQTLAEQQAVMAAPVVSNSLGKLEDSVRTFPTPLSKLLKLLGVSKGTFQYAKGDKPFYPHWVAGMFMLFESSAFEKLNGFDENFFLYYEDVDICARIWKQGMRLIVCPEVVVIHDAQRDSHRKMKYLYWHISSMIRFFIKHIGRLPSPN
ncbi:glycosyltransferase family 2 protein, partial [Methylicorpusculum sp.]|uniref:glycosyltransferase family 2 protein n=1 Tax=Methylicorpusculum sp. TaxID=2713644 RepID=UPI002ABA06F5